MTVECDFLVIGAGMAGASAAAHLALEGRVILLEAEDQPGYHTTGRSAALFSEMYGNDTIRGLTRASRAFLFEPPAGFAEAPLVSPRPTMYFARADQMAALHRFRDSPDVAAATELMSAEQAQALAPVFAPGYLAVAAIERGSADIDVHGLHQGFLRQLRARGGALQVKAGVQAMARRAGRWVVTTPAGEFSAPVVINAAGAWADQIAQLAGARPVGLKPKRRTALLIEVPEGIDAHAWPASVDIDEQFYFKPDAGLLLLSPADEHDSPPCDAQPEELDVAEAVDRFEQASGRSVRRVKHRWAGLRVFAADRTPVIGFDPQVEGFFWLAGPGGYGIQTAPALGRVTAALAQGRELPADVAALGVTAAALSPGRPSLTLE